MVQHVVYQQTHLLFNRHLDQILLSALYGICKVCSPLLSPRLRPITALSPLASPPLCVSLSEPYTLAGVQKLILSEVIAPIWRLNASSGRHARACTLSTLRLMKAQIAMQVNHLGQISFKEIIQHYKKQPQAKTDIFRTVIIAQSEPELAVSQTGDIIEFYNSVFIPTVKPFVLQLGQRKAPLIQ